MLQNNTLLVALTAILASLTSAEPLPKSSITFRDLPPIEQRGIHNIHIAYTGAVDGELTLAYGQCDTTALTNAHHRIGSTPPIQPGHPRITVHDQTLRATTDNFRLVPGRPRVMRTACVSGR